MCPQDNYPREFVKEKIMNDQEGKEVGSPVGTELSLPAEEFFKSLDHKQVVAHLKNRVEGAWIYQFPIAGKQIVNLGVDGAVETAIALAQFSQGRFVIEVIPGTTSIHDFGDCIDAQVIAGLFTKGLQGGQEVKVELTRVAGYSSQPKFGEKRGGGTYEIQHPRTQAVHKAERNAFNKLIPEKLRKTIIGIAMKEGRVEDEPTPGGKKNGKPNPRSQKIDMAEQGQLDEIANLLKDENLPDSLRNQCDAAVKRGLTAKQAEAWMGSLRQGIQKAKAGKGEQPSMV
jgi:hypothetical protein